ncbi:class I adenylate-forming enzyme family protein [Stappia stellulata]|uniref:class I adenylate-forming enzyme family protein n=1 Tax=Stappia stellulata TaxID=71235 RepID=UPI00040016F6|nr:long-chain fatty acid--CoA ligase [Stappia stellulata]
MIASILARQSDRFADKTAIRCGPLEVTYGQLNARVAATAERLGALGVGEGDKVAHLSFNDISFFELLFACSRLGAVLVPINFRLVADEIVYQLANSEADVVVHSADFGEMVEAVKPRADAVRHWVESGPQGLAPDAAPQARQGNERRAPDACLLMIHTSGTTGRPKAAMLSERNLLATAQNQIADFPLTRDDITLTCAPIFHAGGSLICTLPLLLIGGTVILQKHFDPGEVGRHLVEDGVTCMFAAPAMWQALIGELEERGATAPSLRLCLSGGAAETERSMRLFRKMFGVALMQGYGLSECSSTSTVLRAEDAEARLGSVGKPMMTNRLRIVHPDGRDIAPGEVGEIIQSDDTVMLGYYKDESATRQSIRDGWLHTGDLATIDEDGFVYIKGRLKEMIISGGENIYPAEIEQLLNTHPGIADSAVVGVPDARWGETPMAFVVPRPGEDLDPSDVIGFCKAHLASYKKPSRVLVVDALPRNPSGKVKKFELRAGIAPQD